MTDQTLPRIILASGSPRRKALLASLGLTFDVVLPDVDEKSAPTTHLSPAEKVAFLSRYKGSAVARHNPDALVIAADTLVACNGNILEKPKDETQAADMLKQLSANVHSVFTGISVFYQGQQQHAVQETRVWMKPLIDKEIQRYIATGEPMDKAGAYAIQGIGSVLIEKIDGCYFNVVGLSLYQLNQLIHTLGFSLAL